MLSIEVLLAGGRDARCLLSQSSDR